MSVEFIGPFQEHRVCVDGRRVPKLTASPCDGGMNLVLDGRIAIFIGDGAEPDAPAVAVFVAHAIAIGMGCACHPSTDSEPTMSNPFPIMMRMDAPSGPPLTLVPDRVAQLDKGVTTGHAEEPEASNLNGAGSSPAAVYPDGDNEHGQ